MSKSIIKSGTIVLVKIIYDISHLPRRDGGSNSYFKVERG